MNTITPSSVGYHPASALDLGRAPRRSAVEATSAETPTAATRQVEAENRAAALGSIDDLAGAEAAVLRMRLAFAAQPLEVRAAQGSPSPEKALRLLAE
jgi:hypothetical protein